MNTSIKTLSSFLYIALSAFALVGCQAELVVPQTESTSSDLPEFNFQVQSLNEQAWSDTVLVEIYLKQLDFAAPKENYTLIVSFPPDLEGHVRFKQAVYRSEDWIKLAYQELKENTTRLELIFTGKKPTDGVAGANLSERYTVQLSCQDRGKNMKTAELVLTSSDSTTGQPPATTTQPLPEFNFLVRQLQDSLTPSADTLPVEVYLKQVEFRAPEERYTLMVSFPSDLDGEILYQDTTYRSGDWIHFFYHELKDNTMRLNILPRHVGSATDSSGTPTTSRQYLIRMACHDRQTNTKTVTLTLNVPSK